MTSASGAPFDDDTPPRQSRPEEAAVESGSAGGQPSSRTDDPLLVESLARCIGDFVSRWELAEEQGPPAVVDFLPEQAEFRNEVLVELIKVDLEYRWQQPGLSKRLEEYLAEFPQLFRELPAAVILEEYTQRRDAGEQVSVDEYLELWPHRAGEIQQLVEHGPEIASTVLSKPQSFPLDSLIPGESIDDFDLLMLLGRGAFARVFLARQRSMQRLVALKVSLNQGSEAQTLAQLDHDHIVRVYDQHILPEENLRLLYMQYLPGGTLLSVTRRLQQSPDLLPTGKLLLDVIDETLEARGEIRSTGSPLRSRLESLSWPETVAWIGMCLADGLAYAHSNGVLHRDIKPANVLLSAEGVPKLADFNISYSEVVAGTNPTEGFGGSLAYMSPEHLEAFRSQNPRASRELDGRADLYSLGVLLWELLTGQRPFADPAGRSLGPAVLGEMLESRRSARLAETDRRLPPETPATLIRVLERCLEPDREGRWRSPAEFARQLGICLLPRARQMVDPPVDSWTGRLARRSVLVVLMLILVPNLIAAVGNFLYNQQIIMPEHQREILTRIQGYVNGVAFPAGIASIIGLTWQVRKGVLGGTGSAPADSAGRNCLWLGDRCAAICLSLWTLAGIVYPVIMSRAGADLDWSSTRHFFSSLLIFGLFATAYPFFGVTWFSVRCLLPNLVRQGRMHEIPREGLSGLRGRLRIYLWMAASIPLLAISGVLLFEQSLLWLVQALCYGGLAAFGIAFWIQRRLEEDLDALAEVLKGDEPF